MFERSVTRSLNPTKAGRIFGKHTPSPVKQVSRIENKVIRTFPANRALRRKLGL